MRRAVVLELEVESDDELRRAARAAVYSAWGALDRPHKPTVRLALSAEATLAVLSAFEGAPGESHAGAPR